MVNTYKTATFALVAAVASVAAQDTKCGPDSPCPADAPCCSSYGICGVGAYCLGGCDPMYSHDLNSCMAAPVCKSGNFALDSMDDVAANSVYLGDSSKMNWVSSGTPVVYQDKSMLLTMAPSTVGTLLSSTHYVWYGKISATLRTSQGAGVVTAFILMSDVKDEIDFEFVGVDMDHAQSNYYFQGITDYGKTGNLSTTDTRQNTHQYTIDWNPDSITWSIDGKSMRTVNRDDTWNATTGQYHYPQTPSRIQFSLWPAGLPKNGEGTIDWAGGLVDWDSQYMQNGFYYAEVSDVTVDCYDPPSGYNNMGSKSYAYMTDAGTNDTVAITNNGTILSSFQATGDNPTFDPDGTSKPSGTSSTSKSSKATSTPKSNANTVPGMSGAGGRGDTVSSSSSDGSSGSGSGSDAAAASASASAAANAGGSSGSSDVSFSQGIQQQTNANQGARVVAGSLVALVAFFGAAMML